MSLRIAPMPAQSDIRERIALSPSRDITSAAAAAAQPSKSIAASATSHHRPQQSSEGTLPMSDSEDNNIIIFMDSPASVSAETNMSSSTSKLPGKKQAPTPTTSTDAAASVAAAAENEAILVFHHSDRDDYTAAVRSKYFDSQNGSFAAPQDRSVGDHHHHQFVDDEEENIDFSEIFESNRSESKPQTATALQNGKSRTTTSSNNGGDWSNGDLTKPENGPSQGLLGPSTPPHTLYGGGGEAVLDTPGNEGEHEDRAYARESAGLMSPVQSEMTDAVMFGRISPNAQYINDTMAGSVSSSVASSAVRSSVGSGNQLSSLLSKQPILYSAIGSLEQINTGSLRDLNKRLQEPFKDFCKLGADQQSTLIPPQNRRKSRPATASNAEDGSTHYQTSSNSQNISSSATAQVKKPTKVNGEEVFGVLKKKSSKGREKKPNADPARRSNLRSQSTASASTSKKNNQDKNISYDPSVKSKKRNKGPIEMFRPSSDAYTPRIGRKSIQYKAAEARTPVQQMASPMGTLHRPNFRDALRRVAMIIHQHVVKIEGRFEGQADAKVATDDGLFRASMKDLFNEDTYRTPTYKCNMVRIPMARPGMAYGLRKIRVAYEIPSETEIYEFGHQLFKSVQLSSECSIVCLIYVERLMEQAKVPLLACTWRPIFMCGLLLASKVWQDLSSWNVEFSSVYPQFSLEAINRLELTFLRNVNWDLYISSSLYAKYYFALRSLVEKQDFRQRYNRLVGGVDTVAQSEALKVQKRTEQVKEEALLQLSRSM